MHLKTTKKHFEIFKKECEKWIKAFGMVDWEVNFKWKKLDEDDMAEHAFNVFARSIDFCLTTDWPSDNVSLKDYEIKKSSLHEVFEARLAPLRKLAENRYIRQDEISTEIHAIVQLISNIMMKE